MDSLRLHQPQAAEWDLAHLEEGVTEWDRQAYQRIVSVELSAEQQQRIIQPPQVYPRQEAVLGVHWHPEFVPVDLILQRVAATFPARRHELIIPTQHNELLTLGGYAGVEIDCYSAEFNRKVQLLAHFSAPRVEQAGVFRAMLEHTFRYRSSQLHEFLDSLIEPRLAERVQRAAARTGAADDLVRFVRVQAAKLRRLIEECEAATPPDMLKNKLVRNFLFTLREHFPDRLINHAMLFLQAVKEQVKARFEPSYFYRTQDVIAEVRSLGGGIVIPHPEQFWPILLAEYDVDGIEVWNPQSREFTEFLIHVVNRENKNRRRGQRAILVFMGDDTHFGEKVLEPQYQDEEKAGRELGVQPAWDDLAIRKSLIVANVDRHSLIEEYRSRLN